MKYALFSRSGNSTSKSSLHVILSLVIGVVGLIAFSLRQMKMDEQAFVEGRITQLENMIRNAVIIKDTGEVSTVVTLGKTVTFKELPNGDEEAYFLIV